MKAILNSIRQFKALKKRAKQKRQFEALDGRLIVIDGVRWKWDFIFHVTARSELGVKLKANINEVVGHYFDDSDHFLTTAEVKEWIKKELKSQPSK